LFIPVHHKKDLILLNKRTVLMTIMKKMERKFKERIDQKVFLSQLYPRDVLGTLERKPGGTSDSSGCSSCDCSECRERGDVCDTCSMYNQSSNPPSVRYWSKFEMLKL